MKPRLLSTARLSFPLASAIAALVTASSTQAASIYWDGASASWNTITNWSTASGADTPDPVTVPGAADDAIFNITTANAATTVNTLDANQSVNSMTFNSTGATTLLAGTTASTLTLGTGGITKAGGAVTLGNGTAANDVLLNLAGAQTWVNSTASAFTINNTAATFTRQTGATLTFNKASTGNFAISITAAPLVNSIIGPWAFFGTGANQRYANITTGNVTGLTGTTATSMSTTNAALNYELGGTAFTLGGTNYSGNTIRYAGTGASYNFYNGTSGASTYTTNGILAVGASGTLTFTRGSTTGNSQFIIGNTGELVISGQQAVTINVPIDDGAAGSRLIYSGSNTLILSQANTYTGSTTVSSGTLRLNTSLALQNSPLNTSGSIEGDSTNGLKTTSTALTLGGLTGNKDLASLFTTTAGGFGSLLALTLNPGTGDSNSYSGVIANGAANMTLTKSGAGTQTLTGTNTYTGATAVSAGTLALGHATDTLANGGAVTVDGATAILSIAGNSDTVGAVSLKNGAQITGSGGTLTGSSYAVESGSVSAILGGAAVSLTKTTTGTVTLSGNNTYSGNTTISEGILSITTKDALPGYDTTGRVSVASGATLAAQNGVSNADITTMLGTNNFQSGANLGFDTTAGNRGVSLVLADTANGPLGLVKLGSNILTLTETNTYTGTTTITAGTLQLGGGTIGNDGTIANTSGVTNNGTLIFNRFGNSTAGYPISGTGAVTKLGAGTQTLSGLSATAANNYSGTTTIGEGTLAITTTSPVLAGGLTFGSATASSVLGTLDLSGASATFGNLTVRTANAADNVITLGSGRTLTHTGSTVANVVSVGGATTGSAKLQVAGATGTLTVNDATRNIVVATTDNTTAASQTLNLSGLGTFNATIKDLAVGRPTTSAGVAAIGRVSGDALILAGANTITASGAIVVGGSSASSGGAFSASLTLGTTNALNAASFVIGSSRINSTMQFNTGLTNPSVTLRGAAGGTTRTSIYLGDQANVRGLADAGGGSSTSTGTMNFSAGTLDAMIDSLYVGFGATGTGSNFGAGNGVFTFGGATSVVDINTLVIGQNQNIAATTATSRLSSSGTFTMNGGSLTVNTAMTIASDSDAVAGSTVQSVLGSFNLAGGSATIGSLATPVPLILGNHSSTGTGTSTATLNLTGGTLNMFGDIKEGTVGAGIITSTLTLNGGTLDMNGKSVGLSGSTIDNLNFQSGTLKNVAAINDTGGLTKTAAGTLVVSGANTYTGATTVSAGTLALGADNALPANPVAIGSATLDAATFDDAMGTLDVTGSTVINLGSGANLAFADSSGVDWTGGTLTITGTFVSGSSLRFGTGPGGLTSGPTGQLSQISASGWTNFALDANGYLTATDGASNYTSWAASQAPPVIGGPNGDSDNDGVKNLVEYALADGQERGTLTGSILSFTKRGAPYGSDVTYGIETSTDLVGWSTPGSGVTDNATTISYTFTPSSPAKNFARLKVTGP